MKKGLLIIIILLLASCKSSNKPSISKDILKPNTSEFEYGNLYKLNEIFDNEDVTFTSDYLDISNLGDNEIYIEYKLNDMLFKEKYNYKVVDTTEPLVWIANTYYATVGDKDFINKIICADNYDKSPKCTVEGDYDIDKEGRYEVTFKSSDSNGNILSYPFTLVVRKPSNSNNTSNTKTKTDISDVIKEYKKDDTLIGIDVSKYQGDIDFEKVKNSGVEFVMIRLGLGYDDELHLDPTFEQNIKNASENGLKIGIYFYSYAITEKEAISQANYVIDNIKDYNIEMPIAFDWENFPHFNEYNISLYDLRSISNAYLDTLKNAGYMTVQYGSKNYLNAFWSPIKHDVWLAHYVNKTNYDKDYIMWQLCDNGKVDGIKGDVDLDVFYIK